VLWRECHALEEPLGPEYFDGRHEPRAGQLSELAGVLELRRASNAGDRRGSTQIDEISSLMDNYALFAATRSVLCEGLWRYGK
jgi:hypothetical protein